MKTSPDHPSFRAFGVLCFFVSAPVVVAGGLRPLSTDRPDTTESAYTVDAGHFQFEWELAAVTRDGDRWAGYTLGEVNAKYGLTPEADVQLVVPFYTKVSGVSGGFGDMEIRLKYNVWGNDGEGTAFALMPFVKLPTAGDGLGNEEFEGGLIAPFAFAGPGEWSMAVMAQADWAADEDESGHHLAGVFSAVAGHDLTESTAGFLELVGVFSADDAADAEAYFNTGLTWAVNENWQIDGGIRVGLTNASEDLTPFVGMSMRF